MIAEIIIQSSSFFRNPAYSVSGTSEHDRIVIRVNGEDTEVWRGKDFSREGYEEKLKRQGRTFLPGENPPEID